MARLLSCTSGNIYKYYVAYQLALEQAKLQWIRLVSYWPEQNNGEAQPMLNYPRIMLNYPRIFFLFSLVVLWLAAQIGASLRRRRP